MIQPIILAAGKGTRMRSELPKVLHEVDGKPMLAYVLETFEGIEGYLKPIVVVGYKAELVRKYFGNQVQYATQEVQSGTASAVAAALTFINQQAEAVLVVYGDQPFLCQKTLLEVQEKAIEEKPDLMLGVVTVPTFEGKYSAFSAFGRLVRKDGTITGIVEYKNASEAEKNVRELNAGLCLIGTAWLAEGLSLIKPNDQTGEQYLTELAQIAYNAQKHVSVVELEPRESLGINSPEDAAQVQFFV